MGKLNRRRLVTGLVGGTSGIVTALVGVFMLSIPVGLILTGLIVTSAFALLTRVEEPEK